MLEKVLRDDSLCQTTPSEQAALQVAKETFDKFKDMPDALPKNRRFVRYACADHYYGMSANLLSFRNTQVPHVDRPLQQQIQRYAGNVTLSQSQGPDQEIRLLSELRSHVPP